MNLLQTLNLKDEIEDPVTRFVALIQLGVDAWAEAGQLLVKVIDSDPEVKKWMINDHPFLTPGIIDRFEAIGRRQVFPRLFLYSGPAAKRLMLMPYEVQEEYIDKPIPIIRDLDRQPVSVMLSAMSATDAEQLFDTKNKAVRGIAEQKAYLKAQDAREAKRIRKPVTTAPSSIPFVQEPMVCISPRAAPEPLCIEEVSDLSAMPEDINEFVRRGDAELLLRAMLTCIKYSCARDYGMDETACLKIIGEASLKAFKAFRKLYPEREKQY